MSEHKIEIQDGNRFKFGSNWSNFIRLLNNDRILKAEKSLINALGVDNLENKLFMDVGSGSGLFSLAAKRLGAKVISIDFDPECVACTNELKRRYFPTDDTWHVVEGSVLDNGFFDDLPKVDILYSWGVLHHTGDLWSALKNVRNKVQKDGSIYIALYNDQGTASDIWLKIKQTYNKIPSLLQPLFVMLVILPFEILALAINITKLSPLRYLRSWTGRRGHRGMNKWHDWVDWVGGLPFEVATPEDIVEFFMEKDFNLTKIRTVNGWGNNEFIFKNNSKPN